MTIQEEIHQELLKLQNELSGLDNAVKQIKAMADAGEKISLAANDIQGDYKSHLVNLEKLIDERVKEQTKKLELVSSKLDTQIDSIKSEALAKFDEPVKKIKSLTDAISNQIVSINQLSEKLDKVDFPTRLDKLDATTAGINQAVQNLQSRLERVESNIKDDLRDIKDNLKRQIELSEVNAKQLNTVKLISIIAAALALGAIIVGLVK